MITQLIIYWNYRWFCFAINKHF